MTTITLAPTRRNPDKKAQPVTGYRIGQTDDLWVIREVGEDRNTVLESKYWREI